MAELYGHRPATVALDALLLVGIAALLTAIHFLLPAGFRNQLAYQIGSLDPVTMWTSSYVHFSDHHLEGNLLGYAVGVLPSWALYVYWGRRRQFWTAIAVFLVVFPFFIALGTHYLFLDAFHAAPSSLSRGFSGIVGAIGGFLLGSVGMFIADRYSRTQALFATLLFVLVLLGALLSLVIGSVSWWTVAIWAFGVVLEGSILVPKGARRDPGKLVEIVAANRVPFTLLAYALLALTYLVLGLFPTRLAEGGSFTNVYAHGIGFLLGFVFSVGCGIRCERG